MGLVLINYSLSGSPKPTIVWEHKAFNSQPVLVMQPGLGPRELLTLNNVSSLHSGEYTCKIFNHRGRKILRKTLVYVAEKPTTNIIRSSITNTLRTDHL